MWAGDILWEASNKIGGKVESIFDKLKKDVSKLQQCWEWQ